MSRRHLSASIEEPTIQVQDVPEWQQPVIAVPLSQAFPQFDEVKEFRSRVCLFNHNRTKLFDVVSPKYQVVPHGQAIQSISDALKTYFGAAVEPQVRSFGQGTTISAVYKLPIEPVRLNDGKDVNEMTLLVRNSYDRSQVFSAELGAYRLICSNGAKIGESFGAIRSRHVGSGADTSILSQLEYMIAKAPQVREMWEQWQDTRISQEQAAAMLEGRFPDKYALPVLMQKFPRTKWEFYNDLTRFATHDTPSVQRRMEFDDIICSMFYDEEAQLV